MYCRIVAMREDNVQRDGDRRMLGKHHVALYNAADLCDELLAFHGLRPGNGIAQKSGGSFSVVFSLLRASFVDGRIKGAEIYS